MYKYLDLVESVFFKTDLRLLLDIAVLLSIYLIFLEKQTQINHIFKYIYNWQIFYVYNYKSYTYTHT